MIRNRDSMLYMQGWTTFHIAARYRYAMEQAHVGVGEGHHSTTYISFQKLARDFGHSRAGNI